MEPPRLAGQAHVLRHRRVEIQLLLAQHKPWQRHTEHRTELQAQTLVTQAESAGKELSGRLSLSHWKHPLQFPR